ncbi:hypothetical protein CMV30_19050 [Nibricoccus aquaticus]|uniref:Tyr recombinase domain-containing protein n=1 Tax=Nibricoccus aquaticus TaxID=2576891 RepID=A0A290QHU4_9BACT|nr:tyrosine-type recombinase/integrase [Nibricoccus aquaticus]ATC65876.1 hypothetical protein CMV30_19050 [Nibricoccus aquaticus]
MASIYQRPGSRYWMARFKNPSGEWEARSTKETNPAAARKLAFLWEGAAESMAGEGTTAAQVDKVVRGVWERYTGKRIEQTPTRIFFNAWLEGVKAKKAAKTAVRYGAPVRDFLEHLGPRADADIKSITGSEVQSFIDAEAKIGKSGTTVSLNAKVLRAVFNSAVRKGVIERNPLGLVEVPEAVHEERSPFTTGEVDILLTSTKGTEWETAILLGAYAGMRIGDATHMKWEGIDLAKQVLRFRPEKTKAKKRELEIPLHPRLAAHLEAIAGKANDGAAYVCPTLATQEVSGRVGLSEQFNVVMKTAGLSKEIVVNEKLGGRNFSKKSFHSLRHAFLSGLANSGVAEDVRHKLGGHTNSKVAARYAHLSTETLRKAVDTLPGKGGSE